jgi:ATP-dependent DNA ligase
VSPDVSPPVAPMLARLARELPRGGFLYEPKWDGFRCLAFRDGGEIDLRSRHGRPLARYFPEIVEGLQGLRVARFVVDGEILVLREEGSDFPALMSRLHPAASRVERLRAETPASYVAFDALLVGDDELLEAPFEHRRSRLEELLAPARPPIFSTPISDDPGTAEGWLRRFHGGGVDGVVAKHRSLPYLPGKRAMVKVKQELTADCVVAGYRELIDEPLVASLLLGLYDGAGGLRHVGVATSFTTARRRELLEELAPSVTSLRGHPWERGFGLGPSPVGRLAGAAGRWTPDMVHDWVPLRPDRVCEVAFDQLDRGRFRHPARFRRWRPDREPRSCTFDQLEVARSDVTPLLARR